MKTTDSWSVYNTQSQNSQSVTIDIEKYSKHHGSTSCGKMTCKNCKFWQQHINDFGIRAWIFFVMH